MDGPQRVCAVWAECVRVPLGCPSCLGLQCERPGAPAFGNLCLHDKGPNSGRSPSTRLGVRGGSVAQGHSWSGLHHGGQGAAVPTGRTLPSSFSENSEVDRWFVELWGASARDVAVQVWGPPRLALGGSPGPVRGHLHSGSPCRSSAAPFEGALILLCVL